MAVSGDDREPGDASAEGVSSRATNPESVRADEQVRGFGTDGRLRLLFDNMLEGYAYCRMVFDDEGRPSDFVYVDVNPAFDRLLGLSNVVGRRVTEIIPDIRETNPEVFEIYGRVTRTGVPERFELNLEQLGVVLNISVFRPEPDHFVAVFEDITERKRAQEKLEELVRFLEYRVEERTNDLAEALRILAESK